MLQLLQPIWLFAMAGIAIPLTIHLWNNKQGKVLAIGSIAFLEKTSLKKARSRKVSEWLLLVLRCLLLLLLAFLLAGPSWTRKADVSKTGWILVGEEPMAGTSRTMLDSLIRAGYERHPMHAGNSWSSFSLLDRQAPAGVPFYIFSDARLRHFSGARPVTDRPVHWYVNEDKDSIVQWTDRTWMVGPDSVGLLTGSSGPTGNTYVYKQAGKAQGVHADTTVLRVAIYADDKYSRDGQWVAAAVRALQQFTRRRVEVKVGKEVQGHPDWIFWLSSLPLPKETDPAAVLFYEQGKEVPVATWLRGGDIPVVKEVPFAVEGLAPVWTDGFGRPLLGVEGRRYHFFSHFDPAWNGLVWSADLPSYLKDLLFGEENKRTVDRRMIDPQQIGVGYGAPDSGMSAVKKEASIDLAPAGWIFIWLLLLVERLLSFKRTNNNA